MTSLNKYFHKRRALANGITFAGGSLGNFVIPYYLRLVVDVYGFTGGMLMFSGLWGQLLVVGALMRPLHRAADKEQTDREQEIELNSGKYEGNSSSPEIENLLHEGKVVDAPTCLTSKITEDTVISSTAHIDTNAPETSTSDGNIERSTVQPEMSYETYTQINQDDLKWDNQDLSLLRLLIHPTMLRTAFMVLMAGLGFLNLLFVLPPLAREIGQTKARASLLVSIAGGSEFLFRFLFGYIADKPNFDKPLLIKVSFLLCGVVSLVISFYVDYTTLVILACVIGSLGGNYLPLMGPIMVETFGEKVIGTAMGICTIPLSLSAAVGPPLAGIHRYSLIAPQFKCKAIIFFQKVAPTMRD